MPRRKILCYRNGTPVRPIASISSTSASSSSNDDENIVRRARRQRRVSTVVCDISELEYYYCHADELDPVWDGLRRFDRADPWSGKKPKVKVKFDRAIFRRKIPLHPASIEEDDQVDPLDSNPCAEA